MNLKRDPDPTDKGAGSIKGVDDAFDEMIAKEPVSEVEEVVEKLEKIEEKSDPKPVVSIEQGKEEKPAAIAPEVKVEAPAIVTPEQITEAISKGFESLKPKVVEEPKLELYEATDEDVDAIIEGGQVARDVLTKVHRRAVEDTIKILAPAIDKVLAERLSPVEQFVGKVQVSEGEKRFFAKYADLEPVADLAREVATKIATQISEGKIPKFENEEKYFEAIATLTNKLLGPLKQAAKVEEKKDGPKPPGGGLVGGAVRRSDTAKGELSEDKRLMKELADSRY